MKRLSSGQPGWKTLFVKVFTPHNSGSHNSRTHAKPGRAFSKANIQEMLDDVVDQLDMKYPEHEWRMVELAPNKFNFVWVKQKEKAMKPTIGRIVIYRFTDQEKELKDGKSPVNGADEAPAMVVRVWGESCVNLKVILDGEGTLWATSRNNGEGSGNWRWPERAAA